MSAPNRSSQRRLQTLAANLTASEGPLRVAIDELGRIGIGARIIKSAIAASLAWIVAGFLPRESAPFVAALTAVYTIDLTILKSLRSAWQRVAGITLGIAMAFLAAELFGVHFWTVGLVILFSMVVGLRLNLKADGMTQVAGTAIVVLVVRSTTEERSYYALTFLADTAIGTLIGLTVNSLLIPPNYLPGAQRALNLLINRLIDVLDSLASMVVDGITDDETVSLGDAAAGIGTDLRQVEESLESATEAMRFNLMATPQRTHLEHFQSVDDRLDRVITALQGLIRSLAATTGQPWMMEPAFTEALANLVSASGQMLLGQGPSESRDRADLVSIHDVRTCMAEVERAGRALGETDWVRLGQVIGAAQDLGEAAIGLNGGTENGPEVIELPDR